VSFKAGKVAHVLMDNVAASVTNISAYADQFDWPQSTDMHEVSAFGDDDKSFVVGMANGDTVTCSGPLDVALGTFISAVKAGQSAGSATSTLTFSPGGSVSGQIKVSAEVYVSAYNISTGVNGRAEYNASLQVTGAVTNSTW